MNQTQTDALGTGSVGKLMFRLALPSITAQIINLLYNLVDRMYIGHMDRAISMYALTGVGVCLPLIMIISAFAALAGMGSAPRASIYLGKNDKETAENILGNSTTLLFFIAVVLTFVMFYFAEDMLLLFGASENTISYAVDYMKIYSLGTIFVQFTLGLNPFISAQGFAKTSMLTVLIGAICNIILDPIFIFAFNMGVSGAALATIISQAISMIWILWFLTGKKTTLKIRKKYLWLKPKIFLPCIALGLSPFIMQFTESVITVCFNASLNKFGGDIAVSTMTILSSIMQFSMLPLTGLTQGAQPVISYNFGAKKPDRVKKAFQIQLISCVAFSTLLWAAIMITPKTFVLIFNNDPALLEFAIKPVRIYMCVSCIFGIQIACQQTFIALGNAKSSLFLALLRKVILLIPLIFILPMIFSADKTMAVYWAEPVADMIAVTVTAMMFFFQFRKAMNQLKESSLEQLQTDNSI